MTNQTDYESFLSSIFSDENELFRSPAEPDPGDEVTMRIRMEKDTSAEVFLMAGPEGNLHPMTKTGSDDCFDSYETAIPCPESDALFYSFVIKRDGQFVHYTKSGTYLSAESPIPDPAHAFKMIPGFHVPDWAVGALQYQIFPDRFANGNPDNDVKNREYSYDNDFVSHVEKWDTLPASGDFRHFYGGDLQGVLDKLDYLKSLGIQVIYLNPIFVSPSSHGYDTQDYEHIDPHLAVIPKNEGSALDVGDLDNVHASLYISRTMAEENQKSADAFFARFCEEVHRRGMRIILDGVFNHCGSFHRWIDCAGIYHGGAYSDSSSPYRSYFGFRDDGSYECWWDFKTLPKLNYEASADLCEKIIQIGEKWAGPPYRIDGWRLDVAADLGHSPSFNHGFWKAFRKRVKAVNPELIIVAEHYGDPSEWLGGDEWDTVMNYDAFMEPVSFFLTGMEKHCDYKRDDLYQNGPAFFDTLCEAMSRLPAQSLNTAMNQLSNHDHSRFLTRTNGIPGRFETLGSAAAEKDVDMRVFREAVVLLMTLPGAPTVYYGDEAGLAGWTDPDNRRTYPWGHEDTSLIDFHRALAALHERYSAFKTGCFKPLAAGDGYIVFARFDSKGVAVVAVNNADSVRETDTPVLNAGIPDGSQVNRIFITLDSGFDDSVSETKQAQSGKLKLNLAPKSAQIYYLAY